MPKAPMRMTIAIAAALALARPAVAEPVSPPPGCRALATLIYETCGLSVVSSCAGAPPGHRLYEFYRDGVISSRSMRQDGVFAVAAVGGDKHREFNIPSGLLGKVLKSGEGTTVQTPFATETRTPDGTERLAGVMRVQHQGFEEYPLPEGPVRVLRIFVAGQLEDGQRSDGSRLVDLAAGLMLVLEVNATYPDGSTQHFDYRTIRRLRPGDPGFAEPVARPGSGCGEKS